MANDQFERGDIRSPTVAALCKRNLYRTCNMLKDLEKAQMMKDQQSQGLYDNASEEPRAGSSANGYYLYHNYNYSTSPMPEVSSISHEIEMGLQNEIEGNDDEGKVLKQPFFYEVYSNWKQEIKR